jgi:hypothetical protein
MPVTKWRIAAPGLAACVVAAVTLVGLATRSREAAQQQQWRMYGARSALPAGCQVAEVIACSCCAFLCAAAVQVLGSSGRLAVSAPAACAGRAPNAASVDANSNIGRGGSRASSTYQRRSSGLLHLAMEAWRREGPKAGPMPTEMTCLPILLASLPVCPDIFCGQLTSIGVLLDGRKGTC